MTDNIHVATYRCDDCKYIFQFRLEKLLAPSKIMECPKCQIGTARLGQFDSLVNFPNKDK